MEHKRTKLSELYFCGLVFVESIKALGNSGRVYSYAFLNLFRADEQPKWILNFIVSLGYHFASALAAIQGKNNLILCCVPLLQR